jgi:hypothetical protein
MVHNEQGSVDVPGLKRAIIKLLEKKGRPINRIFMDNQNLVEYEFF